MLIHYPKSHKSQSSLHFWTLFFIQFFSISMSIQGLGDNSSISSAKFVLNKCLTSDLINNTTEFPSSFFLTKKLKRFSLSLIANTLKCGDGTTLILSLGDNSINSSIPSPIKFSREGYMKYNSSYLSPDEYCVQSITPTHLTLDICTPKYSPQTPHIPKCCEIDEVVDLSNFHEKGTITCRPSGSGSKWSPTLYKNQYTPLNLNETELINPRFVFHPPRQFCTEPFTLMTLRGFPTQEITPFRILENGSILEKVGRTRWNLIQGDEICIDGAQNFPLESVDKLSGDFSGQESDTIIIDCRSTTFASDDEESGQDSKAMYITALAVAILFLALTILAHLILWKKQRIRGWSLMGYVTFLSLEFSFLILARLVQERGVACTVAAIGTNFTSLATFSWLTVMNFDVWWVFRKMNPIINTSAEAKIFCGYALFATTVPTIIVTVGLILDDFYGNDPFSEVIVPDYGRLKCGLGPSAEFPYLFGPISVLLSINLLLLVSTLYHIYTNQKILKSNGIKTKILNDKKQFFGMLFLVAGITWIFDVVSWATTPSNSPTPWYWMFFDFVNIFQAIAIFIIFVCNPKTIKSLQKQISLLKSKLTMEETTCDANANIEGKEQRKLSITQVLSFGIDIDDTDQNHLELK